MKPSPAQLKNLNEMHYVGDIGLVADASGSEKPRLCTSYVILIVHLIMKQTLISYKNFDLGTISHTFHNSNQHINLCFIELILSPALIMIVNCSTQEYLSHNLL